MRKCTFIRAPTYVYIWHDPNLDACKIGKTNSEKRFQRRAQQALGNNPRIVFKGVWRTPDLWAGTDAGIEAAEPFRTCHFGTSAREWYAVSPEDARDLCEDLFGAPIMTELPTKITDRTPYDVLGSTPKPDRLSRIWIHRERRTEPFLKVSDNSWWAPNLRHSFANTFNPTGFELAAAYEYPGSADNPNDWGRISQACRDLKHSLHDQLGASGLHRVERCGWICAPFESLRVALEENGLVSFDPAEGMRIGVKGQGQH